MMATTSTATGTSNGEMNSRGKATTATPAVTAINNPPDTTKFTNCCARKIRNHIMTVNTIAWVE